MLRNFLFLLPLAYALSAEAPMALVDRRVWIETASKEIVDEQCDSSQKQTNCIFSKSADCKQELADIFPGCAKNSLPELPEYIEGPETKAQAKKIISDCISTELNKKYVLSMSKERLEEYNICTGAAPRKKPLSANLQKALDFSKTQIARSCADGGFLRKCFSLPEGECKDRLELQQQQCTLKMEAEGISVKPDESSIQEAGRKITDCTLQEVRKSLDSTRKRLKDKDC